MFKSSLRTGIIPFGYLNLFQKQSQNYKLNVLLSTNKHVECIILPAKSLKMDGLPLQNHSKKGDG